MNNMIKEILKVIIGILIIVFQVSFLNLILPKAIIPNLLVIFIVITSLYNDQVKSMCTSMFMGVLLDTMVGSIISMSALVFLVVSYLISKYRLKIYRDNRVIVSGFVFITSIIYNIAGYILTAIRYNIGPVFGFVVIGLLITPLINSLITYFIFNKVRKFLGQ